MPLDITLFRTKMDDLRESQRRRYAAPTVVEGIMKLDADHRTAQHAADTLRRNKNDVSKVIGLKKRAKEADGEDAPIPADITASLMDLSADALGKLSVAQLKTLSGLVDAEADRRQAEADTLERERDAAIAEVGNLVHEAVPVSANEDDNKVIRSSDPPPAPRTDVLMHADCMAAMQAVDCGERATAVGGSRAYYLKGDLVALHLALLNYAMSFMMGRGFTPMEPPAMMRAGPLGAVCQLSDFQETLYPCGEDKSAFLVATAEQPIAAYHADQTFRAADLPLRYAGWSPCFRREAGSHGRDTRGIFRVHQFDKVEQFVVCEPDKSWEEFDRMVANAEAFYTSLGIAWRTVDIVSGALNNAAARKHDLEGWFPGSAGAKKGELGVYRELVSVSNCTDYQSRAIGARFGNPPSKEEKRAGAVQQYVHMLNGTLSALSRTMCCICETHQTLDGVRVPPVLVPFMGGRDFLPFAPGGRAAALAAAAAAAAPPPPVKAKAEPGKPKEEGRAKEEGKAEEKK